MWQYLSVNISVGGVVSEPVSLSVGGMAYLFDSLSVGGVACEPERVMASVSQSKKRRSGHYTSHK